MKALTSAIALFCLFISFSTLAQTNQTILVMGDSLSAEYGLVRGSGWVKLLEEQLQKQGSPWNVFNASISGETSSGGLSRLPKLLEQKKPGIVFLELGANDALRGLSIQYRHKSESGQGKQSSSLLARSKVIWVYCQITLRSLAY